MYQTAAHNVLDAFSACLGVPLLRREILGHAVSQHLNYCTTPDDEVEDLYLLLKDVTVRRSSSGSRSRSSGRRRRRERIYCITLTTLVLLLLRLLLLHYITCCLSPELPCIPHLICPSVSIYLYVCLYVCLSMLSISRYLYLSIYLYVCLYLSICLSLYIYMSVSVYIYISVYISMLSMYLIYLIYNIYIYIPGAIPRCEGRFLRGYPVQLPEAPCRERLLASRLVGWVVS
jgi:hypothetical protein